MQICEKHRNVFLFILIFSYFFGFYSVVSMLPLIISEKIVVSLFLLVLIYASRYFANFIYSGFFLNLAKKINVKVSLLLGISTLIVSFLIILNMRTIPAYVLAFALIGFAGGLSELKLINTAQKYGSNGVSTYYSGFFFGLFLSILLSGFVLHYFSLQYLIILSISFFIVSFLSAIFIDTEKNDISMRFIITSNILLDDIYAFRNLKDKMFYIFFVKMVCEGFNSMKDLFIPIIITTVLLKTKMEVSIVLAVILIPAILVQNYLGKIIQAIPPVFFLGGHKRRVMSISLLMLFLCCLVIPFTSNIYFLLLILLVGVFSYSLLTPTLNLILVEHYTEEIAEESSLLQISSSLGKLLLTMVSVGIIYFLKDVRLVFLFPCILFFLLLIYLFIDTVREGKIEKIRFIR